MRAKICLVLTAAVLVSPAWAAPAARKTPAVRSIPIAPRPRPALKSDKTETEAPLDMSKALPGKALGQLPSSAQELSKLKAEMAHGEPALANAKQKSASLASAAAQLRQKLVTMAARVESLELETVSLGDEIAALAKKSAVLEEDFRRHRGSVTRLLAVLERLQYEMPPALAVRPDDALAAARGSMLIGASLPPLYAKASELGRRVNVLEATRLSLFKRRADASRVAAQLSKARGDLEGLTEEKEAEAAVASGDYQTLKTRLAAIASRAADFEALVARVAALRRSGGGGRQEGIVTVTAAGKGGLGPLAKDSLLPPVVGTIARRPQAKTATAAENDKNPGLTYVTEPGAEVIAPADGRVLFAGPYRKSGQVLILEITTGYDLVLAGLGRVTVRPDDELLAGEPVGSMPAESGLAVERLYFELRRNGRGLDPRPWLSLELRKAKGT